MIVSVTHHLADDVLNGGDGVGYRFPFPHLRARARSRDASTVEIAVDDCFKDRPTGARFADGRDHRRIRTGELP